MMSTKSSGFLPLPLVTVTNQLMLFLLSVFGDPLPPPTADVIYGSPLRDVYIDLAGLYHNNFMIWISQHDLPFFIATVAVVLLPCPTADPDWADFAARVIL